LCLTVEQNLIML